MPQDYIAVIDFGGQYAHLIAKRVRHMGVLARVFHPLSPAAEVVDAKGIILSGGPQSVYGSDAVPFNKEIAHLDKPLLGLCYGHQLLALLLGGTVEDLGHGEYGRTRLSRVAGAESALLAGVPDAVEVWMSHGDTVRAAPPGFRVLATTPRCPVAAMAHESRPVFGLQFHPEVTDTRFGREMLANFVQATGAVHGWTMARYMEDTMAACREQVGPRNVLMFLSGGVDSTVAFALLTRALGTKRVRGLLIDNGFLRKDEAHGILARYAELGFTNVDFLDASTEFLAAVAGMTDPQGKRIAVGETFLTVRETYLERAGLDSNDWLLGQGTLYPDIIESGGSHAADVIKSHHNRVDRIQEWIAAGRVVEPLAELYKDEVRTLGTELGLPEAIVWRHPFPGPGLSINLLCSDGTEPAVDYAALAGTAARLLAEGGFPYGAHLLPVRSVGVQGDNRTYRPPAVLTGVAAAQDWTQLEEASIHLTNELRGVNRVVALLSPEDLPPLHLHPAYCTQERLDLLREADALATQALEEAGLMREVFQLLVILLPLAAEEGAGGECVVLRPVISEDVMTARFAPLPWDVVRPLAERIRALPGVDAVFYDVTHKPPATFGWE